MGFESQDGSTGTPLGVSDWGNRQNEKCLSKGFLEEVMWAPTQEQRPWSRCSDKQNTVVERQASGVRMLGLKPSRTAQLCDLGPVT